MGRYLRVSQFEGIPKHVVTTLMNVHCPECLGKGVLILTHLAAGHAKPRSLFWKW